VHYFHNQRDGHLRRADGPLATALAAHPVDPNRAVPRRCYAQVAAGPGGEGFSPYCVGALGVAVAANGDFLAGVAVGAPVLLTHVPGAKTYGRRLGLRRLCCPAAWDKLVGERQAAADAAADAAARSTTARSGVDRASSADEDSEAEGDSGTAGFGRTPFRVCKDFAWGDHAEDANSRLELKHFVRLVGGGGA
jgi:hypothetical protein